MSSATHSILRRPIARAPSTPNKKFEEPLEVAPSHQKVPLILQPPKSVPKPAPISVVRTKIPNRLSAHTSAYRNWMTDLIGITYKDAVVSIRRYHSPFRIMQVDDVIMDNITNPVPNEIYLVLTTPEKFTPSGFTVAAKKTDRFRVSNWFTRNSDKAIVCNVKVSPI